MAEIAQWRRPASTPFPSVWRRFSGARPLPDGSVPSFWIQDVPEERMDEVADFMCESFLREENMCRCTGVREDPTSLAEIRQLWRTMLRQRMGLAAFTDGPEGGRPRLAGCNVTAVMVKGEHLPEMKGVPVQKVIRALHYIEDQVDVWERYGVSEYMTALGLSVAPEFRGQGLGRELLLARSPLCRAAGVHLTVTVFTGTASQKESARAGFELLAEVEYAEYREGGELVFPGAACDTFQLKAKRIE